MFFSKAFLLKKMSLLLTNVLVTNNVCLLVFLFWCVCRFHLGKNEKKNTPPPPLSEVNVKSREKPRHYEGARGGGGGE